jgi:hypothetical protein
MARAPRAPAVEQLARLLVDREPDSPFALELAGWLTDSPRFRAFVGGHGDKIRKKLRAAADPEALRDVRAELQVARLLLANRRLELEFEAYGSGKLGPDFTLTWPGSGSANLEVTRLRRPADTAGLGGLLMAKLRQLRPARPNAILVSLGDEAPDDTVVTAAVHAIRRRADAKDEEFFVRRGFDGSRGFYEQFLRLSAVFLWAEGLTGDARAAVWVNRSARIPFPDRVLRATLACLRG